MSDATATMIGLYNVGDEYAQQLENLRVRFSRSVLAEVKNTHPDISAIEVELQLTPFGWNVEAVNFGDVNDDDLADMVECFVLDNLALICALYDVHMGHHELRFVEEGTYA